MALDSCILILFFLVRILSVQLYTWMHPSSVPSHIVGCCCWLSFDELSSVIWLWSLLEFGADVDNCGVEFALAEFNRRNGWFCSGSSESSLELLESSCISRSFPLLLFVPPPLESFEAIDFVLTLLVFFSKFELPCDFRLGDDDALLLNDAMLSFSFRLNAGTDAKHNMRALQTPLQLVTVGSGDKLSTHTCPTYPSLLQTHTSFCAPSVAAAHVNWRPARVFRIDTLSRKKACGNLGN